MPNITLNGRTFSPGSIVTFNELAANVCYAPAGLKVLIHMISANGSNIGLYSPDQRLPDWGDLDGEVKEGRGWWIKATELEPCIREGEAGYEIADEFKHKGESLKGKPCRMLAGLDNGLVFVEFEEHVDGCSADGLGKAGYCVALNSKVLKKRKRAKHAN